MKYIEGWALAFVAGVIACGASFTGPATAPAPGSCDGHMQCGSGCCTEAAADGEGWMCGSDAFEGCPAGSCCFTGQDVGPGDMNGRMGAKKLHAYRLAPPRVPGD